jgi:transposase
LAEHRRKNRENLLQATEKVLQSIKIRVDSGTLAGEAAINMAIGEVINKYRMKKHFIIGTSNTTFEYRRNITKIEAEAFLDGIYVIRTSMKPEEITSSDCVREYKKLTQVERAFRSMKTVDLRIRPVFHYRERRVRTHFFICMLAYYVTYYMKEALKELTFSDENPDPKSDRDPVTAAKRSESALSKIASHKNDDDESVTSFQVLLAKLSTHIKTVGTIITLNNDNIRFQTTSDPTAIQKRALELLGKIEL